MNMFDPNAKAVEAAEETTTLPAQGSGEVDVEVEGEGEDAGE